jgi:hypothetical protein
MRLSELLFSLIAGASPHTPAPGGVRENLVTVGFSLMNMKRFKCMHLGQKQTNHYESNVMVFARWNL